MTTIHTNPGASASDAITHSAALAYCAIETIARGVLAAYVLARSIHRAIAASAAPRRQCRPIAPHVQPLFEALAPLSNAQLRAVFNHARKSSNIALCALAVL